MCEQCTVVFASEIAVAWEEWPVCIYCTLCMGQTLPSDTDSK